MLMHLLHEHDHPFAPDEVARLVAAYEALARIGLANRDDLCWSRKRLSMPPKPASAIRSGSATLPSDPY
jgi:hypothetical protein